MRRVLPVVAILLAAGLAVYFWSASRRPEPSAAGSSAPELAASSSQDSPRSQTAAAASPAASNPSPAGSTVTPSPSLATRAGQLIVGTNGVADLPPATVLANVGRAVRQFGEMFGGNPVGTNPEITSQLLGHNPRHINFIDPSAGMRVNDKGELVDAWGTPYFFHQISGSEMEIHSAGPDKIMWTADDLVVK